MAEKLKIYKCNVCGNIVEVLHPGPGELVCCNQPMQELIEKTADEGKEKHVPVIEKVDGRIKVKVGSIPHPMEEKHYIEWIEVRKDGKTCRQYLKSGDAPEAKFDIEPTTVTAREHCTIHGLWKGA
ncbi:MAG: desulfoferrodoxin [Planctomycetota bacterium]|nr:MAG: desulfoferrodoxin [Planctomycetota bacterium]